MEKPNYFVLIIHYDNENPELNNYAGFQKEFQAKVYAQTMIEKIMGWDSQLQNPQTSDFLNIYDGKTLKYVANIVSRETLEKNSASVTLSDVASIIQYFISHYRRLKG